ncbi:MAG: glucosylglycerol hydrolase [Spirochaetaceae bacterium]
MNGTGIRLDSLETRTLSSQARRRMRSFRSADSAGRTTAARSIAREIAADFLGAEPDGAGARFGFWVPRLQELIERGGTFELELLLAPESLMPGDLSRDKETEIHLTRVRLPLEAVDELLLAYVHGVPCGTRTSMGALYWVQYTSREGTHYIIRDPLAASMPFGVYAPGELYDVRSMHEARSDTEMLRSHVRERYPDGSVRARDIGSTLEIHVGTATESGTLAGLTRLYRGIARKIRAAMKNTPNNPYQTLTSFEKAFVGYDSVELMPEVPQAERVFAGTGEFFRITDETVLRDASAEEILTVTGERTSKESFAAGKSPDGLTEGTQQSDLVVHVKRPDLAGWGYDVVLFGTAAINPSLLETGRPDEFLELIDTLHTMPDRPIQVALDSVLGHADFQGALLMPQFDPDTPPEAVALKYRDSAFLKGTNMYGRDVNYSNALPRAILYELYRRKNNYGVDAVRVDGGQDFVDHIDGETGLKIQDDAFLQEMAEYRQRIAGVERRLDINIEDGRPWPDDINWSYNSSYLCHVWERVLPHGDRVKQWGPLIFAHNVHGKFRWFYDKWDRFKDCFTGGEDWITGSSTHDNARYFYRMVPPRSSVNFNPRKARDAYYNSELGKALHEAPGNALNNPGLTALNTAFLPGSPMFFLQSTLESPWLFFRDIQDRYDIKVVADEAARFLSWYVSPELYRSRDFFTRMKARGFKTLSTLVAADGSGLPGVWKSGTGVQRGFMDVLFALHERIKTDGMVAMYLFEPTDRLGGYKNADALRSRARQLADPHDAGTRRLVRRLQERIDADTVEAKRKEKAVRGELRNAELMYREEPELHAEELEKLAALTDIAREQSGVFSLLIEDSARRDEYDPAIWASNRALKASCPPDVLENGKLTVASLRRIAADFMADAAEACVVSRHADRLNDERIEFALACRRFRNDNPWLAHNPGRDVRLDFFNRNVVANGARQIGGWSDTGDPVNANTIYYGWRTDARSGDQYVFLANMEGRPLRRYSLRFLFPFTDEWQVVVKSPGMSALPRRISRDTVLAPFRAGDVFIARRSGRAGLPG